MNGLAPKCLANYLNTYDNWIYKTRVSEHNNIKRFGTRTEISNNRFFFSGLMNGANWIFL